MIELDLERARCTGCGVLLAVGRLWAGTCVACMAAGCPKSPDDAFAGNPCDACDCVHPKHRRACCG